MSTREIIAELPHLTVADLKAVERRIHELTSRAAAETGCAAGLDMRLRAKRLDGRLVLTGQRVIRQAEVEAILDEFP